MESEKKEAEKAEEEKAPTPDERIARNLGGIKDALFIIVFIMLLGQCTSGLGGKSEESKALWSISHSLDGIAAKLDKMDGRDGGLVWQLRELNKNISDMNGTIWNKSCPP